MNGADETLNTQVPCSAVHVMILYAAYASSERPMATSDKGSIGWCDLQGNTDEFVTKMYTAINAV